MSPVPRLDGMIDSSITVTGVVATPPRFVVASGVPIVNFRIAATSRKQDKRTGEWSDGHTNWFDVSAFRSLAENVEASLAKGDAVIISGRVRIKDWEGNGKSGRSVEIEAKHIGHDLALGTGRWSRRRSSQPEEQVDHDADHDAEEQGEAVEQPADAPDAGWRPALVPAPADAAPVPF